MVKPSAKEIIADMNQSFSSDESDIMSDEDIEVQGTEDPELIEDIPVSVIG